VDLVPAEPRVHPVGRLDLDSEGLIVLTNDGELTHHLTHPRFGVEKEYLVHVRCGEGGVPESALNKLRNGVTLEDGVTSPAKVGQVQPGVLRIVIHEGRHRQVRRMCDAVGHEVNRLVRTRIGPIVDIGLKPGEWRHLTTQEVRALSER
ncbi:MAG: pseudouridine synthase, partial [Ilumatobacteraceae bacterium]